MTRITEKQKKNCEYELLAKYNGKYVGKLVYQLFVFDAKTAIIVDLTILADMRRKGIATELVETAIEQIFARKYIDRILIQDGSDNGATGRIVSKLGFHKNNDIGYCLIRNGN